MADAQQALANYQQAKNEEGQVDAYLQLSGIYSRQNKYKLALDLILLPMHWLIRSDTSKAKPYRLV
ncbi:MAG: hypothetical protein WDM90_02950 [Ferruginibacter sp.]